MPDQRYDCYIERTRRARGACIAFALGASVMTAGAATQPAAWCESRWEQVSDRYLASKPPDSSARQTQQYRDTLIFIRKELERTAAQPSPR
jgi:hypothetical protein